MALAGHRLNRTATSPPTPLHPVLLIRGGSVLDGISPTPKRADVLIECGRIVAVDTTIERDGALVVEAEGCTIIPGLVDCHVHLTQAHEDQVFGEESEPPLPDALRMREAERWADAMVRSGFTAVRDLGSEGRLNIKLAEAIQAGAVPGPEVIACGWRLGPDASSPTDDRARNPLAINDWLSRGVRGVEAMREAVNQEIDAGAAVIKLYGHTRGTGADGQPLAQFTQEELNAGVQAAHARGRLTAIHTFFDSIAWNALNAEIDSIEHGTNLSNRTLWRMASQGVFYCPTLLAMDHWRQCPESIPERINSPTLLGRIERIMEELSITVERAYRAGVQIVSGSDQRGTRFPIGENGAEIACLAAADLSPIDAIYAATSRAACLLGRQAHSGRIRAGFDADLAIVSGNPLVDLGLLRRSAAISSVIKRSVVVA